MQEATRRLDEAIAASGGVLLHGEPGTGRELFARAIHFATHDGYDGCVESLIRRSMRHVPNGRPFVVIDCADQDGLEMRLFGTSAAADRAAVGEPDRIAIGCALHQAIGGTLVLGHVREMPGRLQARLARILRDGEAAIARADGSICFERITIRPIATIDGPLKEAPNEQIIPDLLRRLSQTTIEMPPLRHRREDIPGLVRCLLKDLCAAPKMPPKIASRQAIELLAALPWRGNVRELELLLRAIVKKVPGRIVRLADILAHVKLEGSGAGGSLLYSGTLREARARFERDYVSAVLEQHHGRMAEAARALGIQRTNLYRKVRQLSVKRRRPGYRPQS
jgi:DNA-binding NtrC family response regulator